MHGLREAAFIAGFDNHVTWLSLGTQKGCAERDLNRLSEVGVQVVEEEPRHIHCRVDQGIEVEFASESRMEFDVLYPALGLRHASELATAIGAQAHADGQLVVSDHYETTVKGLYAAGDVALGLNQINVAAGQAAVAATAIHNALDAVEGSR